MKKIVRKKSIKTKLKQKQKQSPQTVHAAVQIINKSQQRLPMAFLKKWMSSLRQEVYQFAQSTQPTQSAQSTRSAQPLQLAQAVSLLPPVGSHFSIRLPTFLRANILRSQELEITLIFLPAEEARNLNNEYRQRDYATDVLSFEGDGMEVLGELVMCPDVLREQARDIGHSFSMELAYMLTHGYLHLLGFEHERGGAEARRMLGFQDELFARLCKKLRTAKPTKSGIKNRRFRSK